jgi:hypothetical protein
LIITEVLRRFWQMLCMLMVPRAIGIGSDGTYYYKTGYPAPYNRNGAGSYQKHIWQLFYTDKVQMIELTSLK